MLSQPLETNTTKHTQVDALASTYNQINIKSQFLLSTFLDKMISAVLDV